MDGQQRYINLVYGRPLLTYVLCQEMESRIVMDWMVARLVHDMRGDDALPATRIQLPESRFGWQFRARGVTFLIADFRQKFPNIS